MSSGLSSHSPSQIGWLSATSPIIVGSFGRPQPLLLQSGAKEVQASLFQKLMHSHLRCSPRHPFNLWKCFSAQKWSVYHHTILNWFWRLIVCAYGVIICSFPFHSSELSIIPGLLTSFLDYLGHLLCPLPLLLEVSCHFKCDFVFLCARGDSKWENKMSSVCYLFTILEYLFFLEFLVCFLLKFCRMKKAGCGGFKNTD